MNTLNPCNMTLLMAAILFLLGLVTFITGIFILINRTNGRDVRTLAVQTTRLSQKGIADDVAGLIGNANALLNTLSDMVRTIAGIGAFLTILGLCTMLLAFWLVFQTRTLCLT